jgi:hypothetical protein
VNEKSGSVVNKLSKISDIVSCSAPWAGFSGLKVTGFW